MAHRSVVFSATRPFCSSWIYIYPKYSSLPYMVTCIELTGEGKILASMFFKYTDVFSIVGIVYLILVSIATWILNTVEKQLSIPGFESPRV